MSRGRESVRRMRKSARRKQLLGIMRRLYASATTQADFTVPLIAARAKVSCVWVYRMIGTEFKELRGKLLGPRRSPSSVEQRLRAENRTLRIENRSFRAQRRAEEAVEMKEAILLSEEMESQIIRLQSRVKRLERRPSEYVVVQLPRDGAGRRDES